MSSATVVAPTVLGVRFGAFGPSPSDRSTATTIEHDSMHTLHFADGKHETFGCLACSRSFVSKTALQRHFDRNPSHGAVTITAADIEDVGSPHGSEELPGSIKR